MFLLNNYKYNNLPILLIIFFNVFLISSIPLSLFDQSINLLISIAIFEYLRNIKLKKKNNILDTFVSLFITFYTLYKSFWIYSLDDKFIFFVFPLLLISFLIMNYSLKNIFLNIRAIIIGSILPIKELIFIPLSIFLTPISTSGTWFLLNLFGFDAYTKGQEVFIGEGGIDITFGCSGSEQIIFTISSMIVLNFLIPFKKINIFYIQIILSILITLLVNILRLCILAVFVHTYQSENFSIFDFLHGPKGSLVFTLISTLFCCEIYKKLYSLDRIIY